MTISVTAQISADAQLGEDCEIGDRATIMTAKLGARVHIAAGVVIPAGTIVGDDVRIEIGAVFEASAAGAPRLGRGVSVGGNATIAAGVEIGDHAVIRAGAAVTRAVPANTIVSGNPASIEGYVGAHVTAAARLSPATSMVEASAVRGVTIHRMPVITDMRGSLSVGEVGRDLPFVPHRYFLVYDVPSAEVRGEHAHRECHEFLICIRGSCSVVVDDGQARQEVMLDRANLGIYLPAMTWRMQYRYSADAMLLVFASQPYDNADYIRNYADFIALGDRGRVT